MLDIPDMKRRIRGGMEMMNRENGRINSRMPDSNNQRYRYRVYPYSDSYDYRMYCFTQ